jgi:aldehyde:ferredoxin oxidoreductase
MIAGDSLSRVLYIDVAKKDFYTRDRSDLFDQYLGGSGVAIQLLDEECEMGADPLSGSNPIIFAVGPLTGLFPLASKVVAMFKSPLTGNLGESHAGGRTAIALRSSGMGALVIKGSSDNPIYISIENGDVHFKDASALWGMESIYTVGRVLRENESYSGMRTIMRIGKAGEQCVKYAGLTTETYRHFGRLGLGAVFGSKKLKAVVIAGQNSIPVVNKKQYRDAYNEIYTHATKSELMKKYHDLGTAVNVKVLSDIRGLPIQNLQTTSFDEVRGITGETLASAYLGRRIACAHCPVACIHIAALRVPYEEEKYFYKTTMIPYDYELIYALGSMLGIGDPEGMLKLIEQVEAYGVDAMSTGVCLAYATELLQKKKISEKETLGISLRWGDWRSYIMALNHLMARSNEFYDALANGVEQASGVYGGEEFALSFGGNEMPGYNTGAAAYVGYLIGARHSHLDNAGYSVDQKQKELSPKQLIEALISEEQWRQILSSLVVCFFARGIYSPELIEKSLACTGMDIAKEEFSTLGETILGEKFVFKKREGFSFDNLRIPQRIFQIETPRGKISADYIQQCIALADHHYG